jgi:hypothetical protein
VHVCVVSVVVVGPDLQSYGISRQTPTLHEILNKVPEDCPLQLTHLALDRMCVCVDSFTLPHLRYLVSLDLDFRYLRDIEARGYLS